MSSSMSYSLPISGSPPSRTLLYSSTCETCDRRDVTTFYCVNCDSTFCDDCWKLERPHRPGKKGPDGFPHEKADPGVVTRLHDILNPPADPEILQNLHAEDEDTTWFGIARDAGNMPIFQDYGRYAALMASSASGESRTRFPRLVSFIGQTGAGKSTLVKMLIEREADRRTGSSSPFPSPVVGSARNEKLPTSGDVHLYADPESYFESCPMLYADCEGLEGGENIPVGARYRGLDHSSSGRKRRESSPASFRFKRRHKIFRGSQRDLAWAKSPEKCRREYAVTELYPRLLYTFSDAIVFVLRNAKTFESTVLSKLLDWAAASLEKSLNQPHLPHAIIALNATEMNVDQREWDVDAATNSLLNESAGAITRDPRYKEFADHWRSKGKTIRSTRDLLECYYASVRVVRIPTKGRYMLIDQQVSKLYHEISSSCEQAYYAKRKARMLSNSEELNVYLQSAFDHFSQDLDTPFNFMEVAFRNNPIPLDFGGNILKLAVAVRDSGPFQHGPHIFFKVGNMVASAIMLDCVRHDLKGAAEQLLEKYYMEYCDTALQDFCALFWPCSYENNKHDRCQNVMEGHSKGHQNANGKIIGSGRYESSFTWETFGSHWLKRLQKNVKVIQRELEESLFDKQKALEKSLAPAIHLNHMRNFYREIGGAEKFISHSVCLCCLSEPPAHPLPCGHVLCTPCVKEYGRSSGLNEVELIECPLHRHERSLTSSLGWKIKFKPDMAGVRILSLDGGGIRGIVILEVLRAIERALGGRIPIQNFFDLIVGTSTGGIIALGLGVENWTVDTCIQKFTKLVDKAFIPRIAPGIRFGGSKYRTGGIEQVLKESFKDEYLFGGRKEHSSSYYRRVAVTATNSTGDSAVIFTNYNRRMDALTDYILRRPDKPEHELKLWEIGRATSAAPTFFKPYVNKRTKETYLDGALFHNNPVRVAHQESKLIWEDVRDAHPDILLSIGTSHNGQETMGYVEPTLRRRKHMTTLRGTASEPVVPPRPSRAPWLRLPVFPSFLGVMVNRMENILNTEQTWKNFRTDLSRTPSADERYERINPNIGQHPPRLDEKDKLDELRTKVIDRLVQSANYQRKIARISRRLIASCFYFEKQQHVLHDSHYLCPGKIRCRFPNGSTELRLLGEYFLRQQQTRFQPYFEIQTDNQTNQQISMSPHVIDEMIQLSNFAVDPVEIRIPHKLPQTTIFLCLLEDGASEEERMPISGFPRTLIVEDSLQRMASPIQDTRPNNGKAPTHRRPLSMLPAEDMSTTATSDGGTEALSFNNTTLPYSYTATIFPHSPDDVNDWISRKNASRKSREPLDPASVTEVFELSALDAQNNGGPVVLDDVELDEDEAALAKAIQLSLLEAERAGVFNTE